MRPLGAPQFVGKAGCIDGVVLNIILCVSPVWVVNSLIRLGTVPHIYVGSGPRNVLSDTDSYRLTSSSTKTYLMRVEKKNVNASINL